MGMRVHGGAAIAATVLATGLTTGLTAVAATPTAGPSPEAEAAAACEERYRFVSAPDLFNADVGTVTDAPGYRAGQPNSWNASYAAAVDTVFDRIAAEDPDDVLVAGDLVEGHWGLDGAGTRTFGAITDAASRTRAVTRAADHYYGRWRSFFTSRGLRVHPAVGDHELGDNPWRSTSTRGWYSEFKRTRMDTFKRAFADAHTRNGSGAYRYADRPRGTAQEGTAYAFRPHPEVQVVTLDPWTRGPDDIRAQVGAGQLSWLRGVLAAARRDGVEWTVVQAHTPVAGPVRHERSSNLRYRGGTSSPLWRTMAAHGVDLYLAGEVHAITGIRRDGIAQVTHGGLFAYGGTNYMVGRVCGDRLEVTMKDFAGRFDESRRLWQTDSRKTQPIRVTYRRAPATVGRMTLFADGDPRPDRTSGRLAPYTPR